METGKRLRQILGQNVKEQRELKKWSQMLLAEKADVSTNTINDIEVGKKFARESTLMRLAAALETDVYKLLKPKGSIPEKPIDLLAEYSEELRKKIEELGKIYLQKMKG